MPLTPDSLTPDSLTPDSAKPLPRDPEELEAAILAAATEDTFTIAGDVPDLTPPPPPVDDAAWRQTWGTVHDLVAGFIGPPKGPALVKHSRSDFGLKACDAAGRSADRLGLSDTLNNGHWIADVAILSGYILTTVKLLRSDAAAA